MSGASRSFLPDPFTPAAPARVNHAADRYWATGNLYPYLFQPGFMAYRALTPSPGLLPVHRVLSSLSIHNHPLVEMATSPFLDSHIQLHKILFAMCTPNTF
jgi:hypothetical protein